MWHLFHLEFVQWGFVTTLLLCTLCGVLSPVVVLKQRAYLVESLCHFVFPGVVVGLLWPINHDVLLWPVVVGAVVTAFLGTGISSWLQRRLDCPPDAGAVACLAAFFALGVLLMSVNQGLRMSPESIFFGDVLALGRLDTLLVAAVCCIVMVTLWIWRDHWDAWLTDEEFAQLSGFSVKTLNHIFPILLTCTVLVGTFAVGSLMISALMTPPALCCTPRRALWWPAVACAWGCGGVGFLMALWLNSPIGPMIVLVGFAYLFGKTVLRSVLH